jgi:hypothetical protein
VTLEETSQLTLDFDKLAKVAEIPGVLPCAVQNGDTGEVILVAYVNQVALQRSIETRSAVFWKRAVGKRKDFRPDIRVAGGARELRAELAAVRGAPAQRSFDGHRTWRYLPH